MTKLSFHVTNRKIQHWKKPTGHIFSCVNFFLQKHTLLTRIILGLLNTMVRRGFKWRHLWSVAIYVLNRFVFSTKSLTKTPWNINIMMSNMTFIAGSWALLITPTLTIYSFLLVQVSASNVLTKHESVWTAKTSWKFYKVACISPFFKCPHKTLT